MDVFVTGATGFVGSAIVQRLHQQGHRIRILVRDPESPPAKNATLQYSAALHRGDVLDPDSLAHALSGTEAVIHLVGIISEVGKSTFENIHTRGTRNVLEASRRAGIQRYVQMSALGTRPVAIARYHQSKWEAEELVRASGLAYTIFRPSLIYGPGDHFVNLFAKISRFSPVIPLIGRPDAKFQPVAVESVAQAFVTALSEPKAIGHTYDLCGPERFTLAEIVDQILRATGRKRLKVQIPEALAKGQATFLEAIFKGFLHKPPPLNRDQLLMLQEDNVGDPDPANRLFGLAQVPFEEGIAKYLSA